MKTQLDCMACFVRQGLDAARLITTDRSVHEQIMRDVLKWAAEMDLNTSPPVLAQRIHQRLREITGVKDPYRSAKDQTNLVALQLLPELRKALERAKDPLAMAVRLAIAGNMIDMGVTSHITETQIRQAVGQAMEMSLCGSQADFKNSVDRARDIVYLADNAGEIVFDRLLIEQLGPARITIVVRSAPILNDATMVDAMTAGLHNLVTVMDNGSDAPGTILTDCSKGFIDRFNAADLIVSKGQGNYETLSEAPNNIYFLFKAKCHVIAADVGQPVGTHMLMHR
jgi:uncharacterized protein with ATP-grasp and redox domains